MLKKIAFTAVGLALFTAPFVASAQVTLPNDCSSNPTIACLQSEIQQLLTILNQLLSAHKHQPSAAIDQSSLSATGGGNGITYKTITGTASNAQQLIVTVQSLSNFYVTVVNGVWTINAPLPAPGNYAVQVIDNDTGTSMGTVLATGTLAVTGGANPSAGTLTASNPNPIPASIVAGGTTGVTIGAFTLQPSGENMNLQQIGLDLAAQYASPWDISHVYIYEGSNLVGAFPFTASATSACPPNFTGVFSGGCYFATTTISSVQLASGSQANFTIKVDVAPIGKVQTGTPGDQIVLGLADAVATGVQTGAIWQSGSAPAQLGARIFTSYPTVAQIPLKSVIGGIETSAPVLRFSITASPSGPVAIYMLGVNISASQASLTLPTYGIYSDSGFSQAVPGFSPSSNGVGFSTGSLSNLGVFAGGPITIFLGGNGQGLEIPAGATYYFEVLDNVTPTGNASVQTTLDGDASYQMLTSANGNALQGNFIWSPNDNGTSQFSTSDWTNGFDISGLPSSGISQTVTASVSTPPTPPPPLLTPPNPINAACPVNYLNNGICSLSHLIGVHTVNVLTPTFFSFVRPGLVYTVNFGDGTEEQVPTCTLPLSGQSSSCGDAGYFTHTYAAAGTYNVSVINYACTASTQPCNLIIDSTSVSVGVSQSVSLSGSTNSQLASALTALESALKTYLGH